MAEDNQTEEPAAEADFAALFREADAIEDPGDTAWRNNGYPEDLGLPMDDADLARHARRAGLVPPDERGDPPRQGPDTLPEYGEVDVDAQADAYAAGGDWTDNGHAAEPDIDPTERAAQEQIDELMSSQAEPPNADDNIEPRIADESDDEDEAAQMEPDGAQQADNASAATRHDETVADSEQSGAPTRPDSQAHGQQQMMPGGPLTAISGAVARGVGTLFRGGAYAAAAGVSTIGAAGLYSARGAKWGWNANMHQRSRAHRSQMERSLQRAATVNEKFARGLGKLEGTEYRGMASERAELMNKADPTAEERGKIAALGAELSSVAGSDPTVRDGLRDITHAIRDSEQVARRMPSHVRKGAISEDQARNKLEAMREPLTEHVDEARGMVDDSGKETGERARRMMEKFSEMLKQIFAIFSLRRQEASDHGAEMAAG